MGEEYNRVKGQPVFSQGGADDIQINVFFIWNFISNIAGVQFSKIPPPSTINEEIKKLWWI